MHGETLLLLTFVFALTAALAGGLVARALHLPPLVGYLLGGIAVSPFTPGFIGDSEAMAQLSEIGVMFMMFGVGLHFSLADLFRVKGIAVPGALLQIAVGTLAGFGLGRAFGWSDGAGIILGLSVSIASTVVLIRSLEDAGLYRSRGGQVATGWLIVEDLATIVILVVLPVLLGSEDVPAAELAGELAGSLALAAAFVGLMLVVGARVLPWVLERIERFCPRELFQLAVVVIALGIATGAALLFDVSVALGAFLAGVVMGGSTLSSRVASEAVPFQDLFSIIFFASVGMTLDPVTLSAHLMELGLLVLLIVGGKWLLNMAIGAVLGVGARTALTVAAGLGQIGEFSFIIGQMGLALGVISPNQYSLILGAAVVSIALNSFLFKLVGPLEERLRRRSFIRRLYERRAEREGSSTERLGSVEHQMRSVGLSHPAEHGAHPVERSHAAECDGRLSACSQTADLDEGVESQALESGQAEPPEVERSAIMEQHLEKPDELERNAAAISDVAPHAKRYLSKYARGRYAVVNFTTLSYGCFDEDDKATEEDSAGE